MKTFLVVASLYITFVAGINISNAQKRKIIINADLIANAKEFKVRCKYHKNSMEFTCCDYKIVESELKDGIKEEHFISGTKNESWHNESWFIIENGAKHTAKIVSTFDRNFKYEDKSNILDLLSGEDDTYEITEVLNVKTVRIKTSYDPEKEWVLKMTYSCNNGAKEYNLSFTNGQRVIEINRAVPIKRGEYYWTSPAAGFEFFESGQALGAYQYQGGAALGLGSNQQLVWLRQDLDDETNLITISAMAAL